MLSEKERKLRDGFPSLMVKRSTVGELQEKPKDGSLTMAVSSALFEGGNYLYTEEQYDNFVLLALDYKTEPRVNSGIFIRWADLNNPVQTGLEIQILDTHGKAPTTNHDCGALYDALGTDPEILVTPRVSGIQMTITCDGSIVAVTLNDEEIVRADLDDWDTPHKNPDGSRNKFGIALKDFPRGGHIGIQDHGGKIWCRNIKVKPL